MKPLSSVLTENQQKWVRALRSGLFKQGTAFLRKDSTVENGTDLMCCLGVACELAELDGVGIYKTRSIDHYRYNGSSGLLPIEVMDWLGLRTSDGQFEPSYCDSFCCNDDCGVSCLTEMNDSGKSFEEIADLIESNPSGLFVR